MVIIREDNLKPVMIPLDSKYLNGNPLEWLLEESDPSISYLTRKEIIADPNFKTGYGRILESRDIIDIPGWGSGILGNSRNFDLFYRGTIWCFAESVERGLDKSTDIIRSTAEFIFSKVQTPSGGFTLDFNPPTPVACRTGDLCRYLLRAGYDDDRVRRGIAWIVSHQRDDGGWLHCPLAGICDQLKLIMFKKAGNGLDRESDPNVTSCFYATIACAMALVEDAQRFGSDSHRDVIRNAAEFFLRRSLYKNRNNEPIRPRGNWNRDFRLIGYPILSQYDILYGLLFIAKAGAISDRRTGETFNMLMSRQNDDGSWNLENAQTGMLYGNDARRHVGKKSKWVTLQMLRLLKLAGSGITAP